jgi:hypothetical protein
MAIEDDEVRVGQEWEDQRPTHRERRVMVVDVYDQVALIEVVVVSRQARRRHPRGGAQPATTRRSWVPLAELASSYRLIAQPAVPCRYCAAFTVGSPAADGDVELVCECERWCAVERCAEQPGARRRHAAWHASEHRAGVPAGLLNVEVRVAGAPADVEQVLAALGESFSFPTPAGPAPYRDGGVASYVRRLAPRPLRAARFAADGPGVTGDTPR